MSLFSVVAFASTTVPQPILNEYNKFVSSGKTVFLKYDGYYYIYVTEPSDSFILSGAYNYYGLTTKNSSVVTEYQYHDTEHNLMFTNTINGLFSNTGGNEEGMSNLKSKIVYSNKDIINAYDQTVFFSQVDTPVILPKTVQEIVPHLLTVLKILLPVGVILLSIILGVSLLPRLVHLFL